jgi:serine/threonine protein kinase
MDLTVANVYGLLLRSKLLSLDEARAMFARWQAESRDRAEDVAQFAAWMVNKGYLTDYQAGLLGRGHADGFFLNDYKILDRLGKGRMAGVYKAQHQLGQVVALKVLPPSKARDPQLFARFQRESRMALQLQHPNIVRAFEVGKAGELHYLVMEYLEGETLEEVLLRRKNLKPDEAVHLVHQALQGLQHIHERGLVHRDLKPANLMIVPTPGAPNDLLRATVKILDIGLGRALMEEGAGAAFDAGLTGEGVMLGTPDYMAPEQARDARGIDIRADIYSLGCVLYHLLTGQPPFPDRNIISQMIRHATEPARPLAEFNREVPDGLQQIVNWMIAKDPAGRYPTPERAGQALQVFLVAGASVPQAIERDPKMRTFLTFLEKRQAIPEAVPVKQEPVRQDPVPVATPREEKGNRQQPAVLPTLPSMQVEEKQKPREDDEAARRKKGKQTGRLQMPVPPPLPTPNREPHPMDAEPVPVAAPLGTRLTKRDLLVFGLGVLSGAIAAFLGCMLALRGRG